MDIKQIEYFVAIAEQGSFTRAANLLGIAQPALSRQIRLLEVELRQNLLLRNGRGVSLTEAGALLLEHCRGILYQIERAREDMGRIRGALAGRVAVGMPPSLSRLLTVPLTRAVHENLPQAALAIREELSANMLASLKNGRIDIALVYNPEPSDEVDIQPLREEALYFVSHADSSAPPPLAPLSLEELADRPLVIPSKPHAIRMVVETQLGMLGMRPTIALEIDSVPAILELIRDGAGYGVLTGLALSHHQHFRLQPIGNPPLFSRLAMVTSARRPSTLTQTAVQNLLTRLLQAVPPATPDPTPRHGDERHTSAP